MANLLTWAIQGEDSPAHVGRLLASVVVREGVVNKGAGAFQVTEDTGANMQVRVGSGTAGDLCVIEGDLTAQGTYVAEHQDASTTLLLSASDATNDRIDLIIVRVRDDDEDSGGLNRTDIEVVEGTPAAVPAVPALPDGAIPLAEVLVQASVTAITDGDITDRREEFKTRGQLVKTLYFTSSGTFEKADYPWLARVRARVQAGGGAGSGRSSSIGAGAGGAGGDYAESMLLVDDLLPSETVTVGAAAPGTIDTQVNGNDSSFGAHVVARGGQGGFVNGDGGEGGQGGANVGEVVVIGGSGQAGHSNNANIPSGAGGNSHLGGGGKGRRGDGDLIGNDGKRYGGGGGGGKRATTGDAAGGDGAQGIVILELYA